MVNNEFRFVDIWDHKLYRLDLTKGPDSLKVIETDASVGWVPNRSRKSIKFFFADGKNHVDF